MPRWTTRASRATSPSLVGGGPGNRLGQIEEAQCLRAGRNTGRERARAGRRCSRRGAPPRECGAIADAKFASGSGPMRICTRPTCICGRFPCSTRFLCRHFRVDLRSKANPDRRDWPQVARSCAAYSSRISTAAAMVVVHSPRLSPTADCVTLLVRTILLEMR